MSENNYTFQEIIDHYKSGNAIETINYRKKDFVFFLPNNKQCVVISREVMRKLRLFSETPFCVNCGTKIETVDLEESTESSYRHKLGFYGIKDGKKVLFTIDHIIAKANGGARSTWSNFQTMCVECNGKKGKQDWLKKVENNMSDSLDIIFGISNG